MTSCRIVLTIVYRVTVLIPTLNLPVADTEVFDVIVTYDVNNLVISRTLSTKLVPSRLLSRRVMLLSLFFHLRKQINTFKELS